MMGILLILDTSPYHINKTVLIAERREPDRMSEYRERKPTSKLSKGLLARVKRQQRNARTSVVLAC